MSSTAQVIEIDAADKVFTARNKMICSVGVEKIVTPRTIMNRLRSA